MSYYETIDGVKCDKALIEVCREAVAGKGDGRVSKEDAEKVFAKVMDGGKITQAELWTLCYCLTAFKWTEAAHDWILESLKDEDGEPKAKKAKTGGSYYETIEGLKCDRGIIDACREAVEGPGDGRVSVKDVETVWKKMEDGGKVTNAERWTLRYCLTVFKFTEKALDSLSLKLEASGEEGLKDEDAAAP
eukprot:CAMPEP_0117557172 /NCGR_PEP_ID=MMETSP0784-20121206/52189_1 /TAXON_ID=39447 /ORGANISM="" /LENGTH=189 /DNA_ID=CAMNT_0005354473 /DNA_START=96 /DNA_END=665 /DNA_ORIENTATION=+